MRLAIFDLDGTILAGNSWHEFFRFELRRRPARAPLLACGWLLRRLRVWPGVRLRELALGGLRGCSAEGVALLGEQVYRERLAPLVRRRAREEIARRREAGCEIVFASGAFDFAVAPLARELAVRSVVASRVAVRDDVCLGHYEGPERLGVAKAAAVREMFAERDVDWEGSCAFTDAVSDAPLLELVGERVFVVNSQPPPAFLPPGTRVEEWD